MGSCWDDVHRALQTDAYTAVSLLSQLTGDSVFADFDVDPEGRVFAARISFDGYGCCTARFKRMSLSDSEAMLAMVRQNSFDERAATILRAYFRNNRDVLWREALTYHDLL